jgi:Holliday junction resolvase RusA-like endonuclease
MRIERSVPTRRDGEQNCERVLPPREPEVLSLFGEATAQPFVEGARMEFAFTVFGTAQPQGSTRAFLPRGWNRPVITSDNSKLKPWRQQLSQMALIAMQESGAKLVARGVPVSIVLTFFFEKPRSERKSARHKTTKPDLDKLLRAVLDGLTGIAYEDDSQVCECRVAKVFGPPARLEVQVCTLAGGVPKTPKTHTLQLFETGRPVGSEIAVPKTHDFGTGVGEAS